MGYAVAVADKDVLSVNMVCCTMASSFERFLIALDKEVATTVAHVAALAVEVGTVDGFTAAYGYTIVAL